MTASPNWVSGVSIPSATAAMLPVPPIHEPASVPKPFHASGSSQPLTAMSASGAPSTTPAVPASMTKSPRPITRVAAPTSTSSSSRTMKNGRRTSPIQP